MRIGIFTHNYPKDKKERQNAGIFVYDLAYSLKKQGHEVFVLCPDAGGKKSRESVHVTRFGWLGKGTDLGGLKPFNPYHVLLFFSLFFSGIRATEEFCRENKIDFALAMWSFPSGVFTYWAKKRFDIPYASWSLGSDIYVYARYPAVGSIVRLVLRNASFLLADGIDLAKRVRKISGRSCKFLPSASRLSVASQPKVIKKDPVRFVFLGRMEPVKGPDLFLSALIQGRDKLGNFHADFVGGGRLLNSLKRKAREKGLATKTIFHGNISETEKMDVLRRADWVVIPSRRDSIPLVFAESMKSRTPVITSDLPDLRYLISKYKIGYTFTRNSPRSLSLLLTRLSEKDKRVFSENTKVVAKLFSIEESAKELLKTIGSLAQIGL